ncbi:MAG: hypothetical protein FJ116_06735 [Deltaproteobacteria bacterium]|nr:hypothetical protein [Deltaproteobacteria bacterium]MBM4317159.1 hypothetical protein [Deltaproteobacteria bacterium]
MVRWVLAILLFLVFTGCGKNDLGLVGTGPGYSNSPLTRAPGPIAPWYPQQLPPNVPMFNPQIPQGMPQQFYPWMPMYSFFRQQPQINFVWFNIWSQWQVYARNYGCGIYNFPIFWNVYFPRVWNYGPYIQLYQFMNTSFYSWMTPAMVLPPVADPYYFWANYTAMPIGGFGFGTAGW